MYENFHAIAVSRERFVYGIINDLVRPGDGGQARLVEPMYIAVFFARLHGLREPVIEAAPYSC